MLTHHESIFFGIFLPIMIGLKMTNLELYEEFVTGANAEPLVEAIEKDEKIKHYIQRTLYKNHEQIEIDGKAIYADFFNDDAPVKQQLIETVSLLSKFGSYND